MLLSKITKTAESFKNTRSILVLSSIEILPTLLWKKHDRILGVSVAWSEPGPSDQSVRVRARVRVDKILIMPSLDLHLPPPSHSLTHYSHADSFAVVSAKWGSSRIGAYTSSEQLCLPGLLRTAACLTAIHSGPPISIGKTLITSRLWSASAITELQQQNPPLWLLSSSALRPGSREKRPPPTHSAHCRSPDLQSQPAAIW